MIPKPSTLKNHRSCCRFTALTTQEQGELQRCVDDLIRSHIDISLTWKQQPEAVKRSITDEAIRRCPFLLRSYTDAWPVEAVLRNKLITLRHRRVKRARRRHQLSPQTVRDLEDHIYPDADEQSAPHPVVLSPQSPVSPAASSATVEITTRLPSSPDISPLCLPPLFDLSRDSRAATPTDSLDQSVQSRSYVPSNHGVEEPVACDRRWRRKSPASTTDVRAATPAAGSSNRALTPGAIWAMVTSEQELTRDGEYFGQVPTDVVINRFFDALRRCPRVYSRRPHRRCVLHGVPVGFRPPFL
ncbi:hypothetical protein PsYK624_013410 [Phanerochaete sordida]|uniref:Uncharacterized protein n=1 Tax=Phanerochaete sordida TaxID=48140 RepID=A0A9P3FZA0_9APHY|nr:hypothetical protein PsYK624_013410 [Phanerochaete sordida]